MNKVAEYFGTISVKKLILLSISRRKYCKIHLEYCRKTWYNKIITLKSYLKQDNDKKKIKYHSALLCYHLCYHLIHK